MLPYVFSATPVGQTIRRLRKERGLTQEELAEQLNVTAQAVSKWENETGMPDISQIVPLASVFGVSTDVIFGLDTTTAGEDVTRILHDAEAYKVYGDAASYLKAYDRISDGLRKYPGDQRLLMNGFALGMSLCTPESGIYCGERRREIPDAERPDEKHGARVYRRVPRRSRGCDKGARNEHRLLLTGV